MNENHNQNRNHDFTTPSTMIKQETSSSPMHHSVPQPPPQSQPQSTFLQSSTSTSTNHSSTATTSTNNINNNNNNNNNNEKELHIAPMLDYSKREFRKLFSILSTKLTLWTDMIVDETIAHSDKLQDILEGDVLPNRQVIQLGSNDGKLCGQAVQVILSSSQQQQQQQQHQNTNTSTNINGNVYSEINLNMDCPSPRVSHERGFGASLMLQPQAAYEVMESIQEQIKLHSLQRQQQQQSDNNNNNSSPTSTPTSTNSTIHASIKCRIAVDDEDDEMLIYNLITLLKPVCNRFILHARKCILCDTSISARYNRSIPPLNYPRVYQLCQQFPDCYFWINGGIRTIHDAKMICHGIGGIGVGGCDNCSSLTTTTTTTTESEKPTTTTTSSSSLSMETVTNTQEYKQKQEKKYHYEIPCSLCNLPNGSCTAPPFLSACCLPINHNDTDNNHDDNDNDNNNHQDNNGNNSNINHHHHHTTTTTTNTTASDTTTTNGNIDINVGSGSNTGSGIVPTNLMGCMMGRAAMDHPALFATVDTDFFGLKQNPCQNRRQVLIQYCQYLETLYPKRCCDTNPEITYKLPVPTIASSTSLSTTEWIQEYRRRTKTRKRRIGKHKITNTTEQPKQNNTIINGDNDGNHNNNNNNDDDDNDDDLDNDNGDDYYCPICYELYKTTMTTTTTPSPYGSTSVSGSTDTTTTTTTGSTDTTTTSSNSNNNNNNNNKDKKKIKVKIKMASRIIGRSLKPIRGMFYGLPKSKKFIKALDQLGQDMTIRNCGPGFILRKAMQVMPDELLDQPFVSC